MRLLLLVAHGRSSAVLLLECDLAYARLQVLHFLAALCGLWNLSSQTRDQNCAPYGRSSESNHQDLGNSHGNLQVFAKKGCSPSKPIVLQNFHTEVQNLSWILPSTAGKWTSAQHITGA